MIWFKENIFSNTPCSQGSVLAKTAQGTLFFSTLPEANIRRITSSHRKHWKFTNKIPASWEFPRPSGDVFLNAPLLSAGSLRLHLIHWQSCICWNDTHCYATSFAKLFSSQILMRFVNVDLLWCSALKRKLIEWNWYIWQGYWLSETEIFELHAFPSDGDRCSVYYSPIHSIQTRETKIFVCWSFVFLKSSLQSWFEWSCLRMCIWSKLGAQKIPRVLSSILWIPSEPPNISMRYCDPWWPSSEFDTLHHLPKTESTSSDALLIALKRGRSNTLEGASCK